MKKLTTIAAGIVLATGLAGGLAQGSGVVIGQRARGRC